MSLAKEPEWSGLGIGDFEVVAGYGGWGDGVNGWMIIDGCDRSVPDSISFSHPSRKHHGAAVTEVV